MCQRRAGNYKRTNNTRAHTPVHLHRRHFSSRDSDASFTISRPSSVGIGGSPTLELYKERSFQQSAVSTINSFLSSHNFPIIFKSTFPSAKDIHETLKFLLSPVIFPPSSKLEDDLPLLLKRLSYRFKLNKSILKSPAAPHQWPSFLALIHWLVQISKFHFHLSSSPTHHNALYQYTLNSYVHYIRGDIDELDRNIRDKIHHEKAIAEEKLKAADLEAELERLRSAPSQKEVLEKEKCLSEDNVKKFHKFIEEFASRIEQAEKVLAEKEKQLEAKLAEKDRIREENEELKRRVGFQTFNARDVERMRIKLQVVERIMLRLNLLGIPGRKSPTPLSPTKSRTLRNQAFRRLKIGSGIQYR